MDLTQGTPEEKKARSKKMMLWFGIGSLIMSFAGLTSAFIISSYREDWLRSYELPKAFVISTILIILSSIVLFFAKRSLKQNNRNLSLALTLVTFVLGLLFINYQCVGFNELVEKGYNITLYYFILIGPSTDITMAYIYVFVIAHLLHVIVGLICLLVVIYNHFKQKYSANDMLGFELAVNFWHFVDILWIYLFLFLYYYK